MSGSLTSLYADPELTLSMELFPPKTVAGESALMRHLTRLMAFGPRFITCTYGAGGSTQDKTLGVISRVREQFDVPVASHLTCVGLDTDALRAYLAKAQAQGVNYIVALRGDPPQGETEFRAVPGGLRYANELVALIRSEFPGFGIAVGGYPEVHREAPSAEADLANFETQGRRGGGADHHAAVLRQRALFFGSASAVTRPRSMRRSSRACCRSRISSKSSGSARCAARRSRPTLWQRWGKATMPIGRCKLEWNRWWHRLKA